MLSQVAATILDSVGVAQFLEKLHFLDDILPFLEQNKATANDEQTNLACSLLSYLHLIMN